jgi:3-hydroxymyristoyl/3-hydroxydecanoyl-(acyl carrier protein) dehydratase
MIEPSEVFHFEAFERGEKSSSAQWNVPADCPYFEGHFPGMPVLPAVGMIDGSLELLKRSGVAFGPQRLSLKKAKFTGIVRPGMTVKVSVEHKENRFDVEWRSLKSAEALASFIFRA